jgi:hypothetical protein
MTQGHLATRFGIPKRVYKQPTPNSSTEAWDLALYSGHLQTHATNCYPNSSLHSASSSSYSIPASFIYLAFLRRVRRLLVTANVVPS